MVTSLGKIVSGIKKVGGFIFKGIKGLLHRRKNTALLNAARTMATRSKRFIVGKLYKFTRFKGLHIGKSSLSTTLKRTWHKTKFWIKNKFTQRVSSILQHYKDANQLLSHRFISARMNALLSYTNDLVSFCQLQKRSNLLLGENIPSPSKTGSGDLKG